MSSWKECKLGELGNVITGKTPSSKNPEDWGFEMPFVTPSDYKNYGKYALSSERKLSNYGISRLRNKVLVENSIMVTCIGSDMGKVVMNKIPVITNQQINSIIPNLKIVDSDFLYYRLVSLYETLRVYGSDGTAVPIVNKTDFENIETEIPPLEEQKAIAEILSSLDDKIDLLHRQNQTLESLAQTIFRQWFIEEAKEEWEEKPLSFFGDIICGKTPSKSNPQYFDDNIPFIKIPDMHGNTFIFRTTDTLSDLGKESQKNKTLPPKSICVSCIATVGLVSMNIIESQTNQQINSIVPNKDIYRYFLYLFMKSSYELLHAMASGGTATLNLNTGDFSKMEILKPDDDTLKNFHEILKPIFDKIFINSKQIQTLENLRDTLLPNLLSGEVRVKI